MALPKQLSSTMYTYPFILKTFQRGKYNSDLSVITNLSINKGGGDNTSWTVDGLPTEIDCEFDITPLYSSLMTSTTSHPFLYLQNNSLIDYLATLAGVDMIVNQAAMKLELAKSAIVGTITGVPEMLGRKIVDDSSIIKEINRINKKKEKEEEEQDEDL